MNKTQNVKDNQGLAWALCVCAEKEKIVRIKSETKCFAICCWCCHSAIGFNTFRVQCIQTTTMGFVCFWFFFFFLLLLLSIISFVRLLVNFPFFLLLLFTIVDEQSRTVTVYSVYQEHCDYDCEFRFGIFIFHRHWSENVFRIFLHFSLMCALQSLRVLPFLLWILRNKIFHWWYERFSSNGVAALDSRFVVVVVVILLYLLCVLVCFFWFMFGLLVHFLYFFSV